MRVAFLYISLGLGLVSPRIVAGGEDAFNNEVRPILAKHCFKCHGPDDKARKARLRLDQRDSALRGGKSKRPAIVPGHPEQSELIQRIVAEDESEIMPPPHAKNPLTAEEKQTLKRWIAGGAEYRLHWSFVPPKRSQLPRVRQVEWVRNPIDYFILARLEREGLKPSPQADRYTLARRLYLDLIGLPPMPDETQAFVNDTSADAYEKLVDRLLASPHYGERWARRWLDLARYADTNGYEKDRPRSIWPYRDWVINAINADMPFDQFTIEQLAGDLLPGATDDQRIATGFHRNTMLNEEGGIDPLEYRFYAVVDRIATTGTTWLGLTIGCAQCHTHKFDPIPQREYYKFLAFLNNADEPTLPVRRTDIRRQRQEIEKKIADLVADLPNRFPVETERRDAGSTGLTIGERRRVHLERRYREWQQQEAARTARWIVLHPSRAKANLPHLTILEDNSIFASGDQSKSDTFDLSFQADLRGITAIRLEVLPDDRLPGGGPGRVYYEGPFGDFFLSEFRVFGGGKKTAMTKAAHSFASGGNTADKAIDGDPQTGWSINGGQGRAHTAVFTLASPLADASDLRIQMLCERYYSAGLGRFRISVTTDARPAIARDIPCEVEDILLIPEPKRTTEQKQRLFRQFLMMAPELAKEREEIERLRKQLPAYPTTFVMAERPTENPRPTFVHNRGEFLQPKERVDPDVFSVLPPLPKDAPRNRLDLARWLVSPENPLTERVTMNRQWAAFFGRGIVPTLQDFGYQGERPSHPELLDWLAVELVKQGWSIKKMHKLIVMSATYRQSSRVTPELLAKDANNTLLARGPRVRLEAEQVRDSVLRSSGLLSEKIGGPSVFPPQPPGVTTEGAYGQLQWKVSQGHDRYRRGLYTFSKRTAPFAMSTTFDAPSGEVCVARREVSNTPLQALTLLNDPAFTEAAQALGRMMAAREGSVVERVDYLFRRCLTRRPSREEVNRLVNFFETQKQRCERKELDAAKIAGAGDAGSILNDRAAWTALARTLFNLDEAIVKD
ncbi:MAG TPA: PSD1 and planctomycete cytochrome C domain-containing protein [Gemmataceae bacterium]|nr:PSD1 and planctomycete cytochrome C domain-containing protein [Gemmataceae bacterium]